MNVILVDVKCENQINKNKNARKKTIINENLKTATQNYRIKIEHIILHF